MIRGCRLLIRSCAVGVLVAAVLASGLASASARPIYVMNPLGERFQHPSTFQFSVNGDLIARGLRWHAWGTRTATARGRFTFSPRPAGSAAVITLGGTLRLRARVTCPDRRRYYSRATISLYNPQRAPWRVSSLNIDPC